MRLVSPAVDALRTIDAWGARTAAAGVTRADGDVGVHGPARRRAPLGVGDEAAHRAGGRSSRSRRGRSTSTSRPGPPGSTLRHLLAHASGLPPDEGPPLMPPGRRRIYSNYGIELAARARRRARRDAVRRVLPRRRSSSRSGCAGALHGSPAWGYRGPLDDLLKLGRELLAPTLVAPETLDEATSVQFPGLAGVLPGFGRMEPNDWGLAFELRDHKSPHWTGASNSPRTFGHFGAAGTFLWVDPEPASRARVLTDKEFGDWAIDAWPRLQRV